MTQNKSKILEYNPELDKPLTESDIDYLWTKDTTDSIMTVQGISNESDETSSKSVNICQVAETDYPGFLVYYMAMPEKQVENKGKLIRLLPSVKVMHVIDTDIIPVDEYFIVAKDTLVGAVLQPNNKGYTLSKTNSNGITFRARIEKKDSRWCFTTVYPDLKENEMESQISR